ASAGVLYIAINRAMAFLLWFEPRFGGASMRNQTFAARQRRCDRRERTRPIRGDAQYARPLLKVVNTERRRKPRGAAGWQHMIGTGTIIADRFARIVSAKNGAGVTQLRH